MKLSNKRTAQLWRRTALATAVLVSLSTLSTTVNSADRKPIGDLEIYKSAEPGTATIFMMLDVSGSMGESSILNDYKQNCDNSNNNSYGDLQSEEIVAVVVGEDGTRSSFSYVPKGCQVKGGTSNNQGSDNGNKKELDRLSRLQLSLIKLFATEVYAKGNKQINDSEIGQITNNYKIGVGIFGYGNGTKGKVVVPVGKMTAAQRSKLIQEVISLSSTGNTPTAQALAEAGAYMMGTNTKKDSILAVGQRDVYNGYYIYRACKANNSTLSFNSILNLNVAACSNWDNNWYYGNSIFPRADYVVTGRPYDTYYANTQSFSGFDDSVDTAKNSSKTKYTSPIEKDQCGGNGIYLLTDGEPNGSSNQVAKTVMNESLQGSNLSVNSCDALSGSVNQAWGCMAEYTALLRNPTNPSKSPIRTATVGYGNSFAGLTGKRKITINNETKEVTDCDSGTNVDNNTRNLCRIGERRGDNEAKTYGDGGFYYVAANSSSDTANDQGTTIASSVLDFAKSLEPFNRTIPAGTITVPDNPYQASQQLPFAYLPMLAPNIDTAKSIWDGNVKKYSLNNGTLYGKNDNRLYTNVAGDLSNTTQDLWQATNFTKDGKTANDQVEAGGVYAQLATPSSGLASVRSVYVEDYKTANDKTPVLRKVGVSTEGKPVGFDQLVDTTTYTELNKRRLLSFLGFSSVLTADGLASSNVAVNDLVLSAPTVSTKVLGGVVHSKPAAISYNATLDANGSITNTRDDYVWFGSMDGSLHLVNADDGTETTAIIPKYMLEQQPKALVKDSIKETIGQPYFGVDAPWLITTDYSYDLENSKVTVDTSSGNGMFAYGGLRMGGEAFYGMDISSKATPKMLFTITPNGLNYNASTDFSRMGQIWSKPTAAKIRISKNAEPIDVLVFGGGYDMKYENDSYKATTAAPAKGNAIYIINASTGALIWSTSGETGGDKNTKTTDMINSISGGITVLDRDNDGLMDHLYAADLGGQVFRADFQNARPAEFGFTAVDNFSNKRIVRVLNTNTNTNTAPYRFYERPVISFYRNEGISGETVSNAGKIFAMVNVVSGNRSAPLSKLRTNNDYANRVYGIIDTDITQKSIYETDFKTTVSDLTESNLVNLTMSLGATPTDKVKEDTRKILIRGTKQGWYYPLTRFDGYQNVKYNKGVGDSVVINSLLYTTVYNPDKLYGKADSCTPKIQGGSERQLYCLPYGICLDASSVNGTGGYVPAGQGIQELTLGAFNKNNTDIKVLIGTTTVDERVNTKNRTKYGTDTDKNSSNIKDTQYDGGQATQTGGDGSAVEYLFNERYTLQPKAWYEKQ
ncbi:hypothetical protein [Psychrobacter aestuarii]|uniref:PilC/PilY family type IV pilus protein n=1 Tax=Psychrobacter aestuarii TaxID=556327 RepID=A0ABN0VKA8_9GAMM|nr:hypothetical protein [Psychrobacter aestuarii]